MAYWVSVKLGRVIFQKNNIEEAVYPGTDEIVQHSKKR